jgi:Ca2+-binding EF-hand superfamily protein
MGIWATIKTLILNTKIPIDRLKKWLDEADANGDGYITLAEIADWFGAWRHGRKQ